MITVEMCVGISVSCMPLISRLYQAKKEKLSSYLFLVGKGVKDVFSSARSKKAPVEPSEDPKNRTYTHQLTVRKNSEGVFKTTTLVFAHPGNAV